eukprot:gene6931-9484_t
MTKLDFSSIAPKASKTCKFRVPIVKPEIWKIKAIASYKQRKFNAKNNKTASINSNNITDDNKQTNDQLKDKSSQLAPEKRPARERNISFDQTVQVSAVVAGHSNAKRTFAEKEVRNELEMLHNRATSIRTQLKSLNTIRYSLAWLLKKASLCERAAIC